MARPKGIPAWNKGIKGKYHHTEATKKKLGNILKRVGEKTRFKKGIIPKVHYEKGHIPWSKSNKYSDESREKMRQAKLRNPTRYWLGKNNPHHSGENNVNWKGGVTPENEKERKNIEYYMWRRLVFYRDHFSCRVCGANGYVQANHILPFRSHKELRTEVSNGITLCIPCHKFVFKREHLFIKFFQGILENEFNSVEVSQEIIPSQQERLRKALWACVEVKGE